LSSGKGRDSYLAMTAGSSALCPVVFGSTTYKELDTTARGEMTDGAKALAVDAAARRMAAVNFIVYISNCIF
jgi:hypothetical protein